MAIKTTIVIGAGANKEINPGIDLGYELLNGISERVTDKTSPHSPYLSNAFNKYLPELDFETRFHFLQHLERYMKTAESPSIDSFMYEIKNFPEYQANRMNQEKYIEIARVMIMSHVFGYEGTKTQQNLNNKDFIDGTWLGVLGKYITSNSLHNDYESLKIITFNYDRILERYLLPRTDLIDFINRNIIHVYGRVGNLEGLKPRLLSNGLEEQYIKFGEDNNKFDIIAKLKDHISLIHDEIDEAEIARIIDSTERLIIFGYGLDYINNMRLGLDKWTEKHSPEKLIFNVYHGRVVDFDFSLRRKTVEKIRSLVRKATIKFLPSFEFLSASL